MQFIKITPVSIISHGLNNKEIKEREPIYVNIDKIRHFGKEQDSIGYLCYEPGEFLPVKETPEEIMAMINQDTVVNEALEINIPRGQKK